MSQTDARASSSAIVFTSLGEMEALVGQHLGYSDWLLVEQDRIDKFAEATGDFQWIHLDPERAATGPFGTTIAHGWLSASLLPVLTQQIYIVKAKLGINYGVNRLRFTAPVRVNSEVRASSTLAEVSQQSEAIQLVVRSEIEIKGGAKPALVAETLSRYYL